MVGHPVNYVSIVVSGCVKYPLKQVRIMPEILFYHVSQPDRYHLEVSPIGHAQMRRHARHVWACAKCAHVEIV
jgi:hypothetical protein